jgi:hypothetical protein
MIFSSNFGKQSEKIENICLDIKASKILNKILFTVKAGDSERFSIFNFFGMV